MLVVLLDMDDVFIDAKSEELVQAADDGTPEQDFGGISRQAGAAPKAFNGERLKLRPSSQRGQGEMGFGTWPVPSAILTSECCPTDSNTPAPDVEHVVLLVVVVVVVALGDAGNSVVDDGLRGAPIVDEDEEEEEEEEDGGEEEEMPLLGRKGPTMESTMASARFGRDPRWACMRLLPRLFFGCTTRDGAWQPLAPPHEVFCGSKEMTLASPSFRKHAAIV
eukprot:NODE_12751_length_1206_cov_2.349398.p2 GENE.NODE_12751_length_1206_cov_2.349398~~NODE_12751_length_1206_cov_2.349398.p2  ORF type:complete len:221 (-),score=43.07 NODE_12751_length_1206_cov_2.349398:261-923(-)